MDITANYDTFKWDGYVSGHINGSVYLLDMWKVVIERSLGIKGSYFVAKRGDQICGILPLFIVRTLNLKKAVISVPYGGFYCGIIADNKEIQKELIEFAIGFSKRNNAEFLELRYLHDQGLDLPEKGLYVAYIKELERSDADILKAIPRKSRASIRNGYKRYSLYSRVHTGVLIDRHLDILYGLYTRNTRLLGSPIFPRSFFREILRNKNAGILTIYLKSTPISSVIFFNYGDTLTAYLSGADNRYNYTNMNNIMYYELMKYALKRGFKHIDLGRSRKGAGSGKFKENMGFKSQQLHFYFHLNNGEQIPNVSPSNKKYGFLIRVWSRLPLFLTRILGPKLIKYFP